jgi:hypothetical protein
LERIRKNKERIKGKGTFKGVEGTFKGGRLKGSRRLKGSGVFVRIKGTGAYIDEDGMSW